MPSHLATSRYLYNTILEKKWAAKTPVPTENLADKMSLISPRLTGLHSLPAANAHRCSLFPRHTSALWYTPALHWIIFSEDINNLFTNKTMGPTPARPPPTLLPALSKFDFFFMVKPFYFLNCKALPCHDDSWAEFHAPQFIYWSANSQYLRKLSIFQIVFLKIFLM